MKYLLLILSYVFWSLSINAQKNQISKETYINTYKKIAIAEMKRSGIPASVTLAQGMLESENGNSTLTRSSNNHFGIKCHKNWDGKTVYQDDDAKNECFRKYKNAEESYRDHTDFLTRTNRYAALFQLRPDDYKGWAKGLKKVGYATSPTYDKDLIRIIEENELFRLDVGDLSRPAKLKKENLKNSTSSAADDPVIIDIKRRKVFERNRIKYIIAEKGDNIDKITKDMELFPGAVIKYNELPENSKIVPGQVVYLQPKRRKAEVGHDYHTVEQGETMYSVSQLYGIKLKKLYRKNRMEQGTQPILGQKLWLRSRKPKNAS